MPALGDGRADGVWCTLGEPRTTAQIAQNGFAWLGLDAQHGAFDDATLLATMPALAAVAPQVPVAVRVAEGSDAAIGRALDLGADIVIVPMIETVEQAEHAVRAAHYPPRGRRSWGPMAGLWGGAAPSAAAADPEVWVMVETPEGLRVAEQILAVPGVSAVFVGPFDLSIGLGIELDALLAADDDADADDGHPSPPALPAIVAAARRAGKHTGAFAGDLARAERLRALGFDRVAVVTDGTLLAHGAAAVLGAAATGRTSY
ncbi:HpcH/HpaI aldolase family protein [Curtobacterium flaccumfaciens]|uniref:HpcH/HpaI aldolase family protein n=1 Tax=Curtobacterium flaccumfaciens TaxID=2035 RepID=UPI002659AFF1|nr:aldolase/citrate lyase family protein [Curtobacterium flaccumfaciens]MCS5506243.1 aldolase/citrate lyase family protein [Curtobacterium flaccumfaciens pv. flaccumfaciens]